MIANGQELNKLNQKALAKFRKESLGFIFQDYSILPTLTVKENIMLPLSVQKMSKATMEENYKAITTALGIYDLGNKYPSEYLVVNNKELQQREHLFTNHKSYLQMSQQAHSTRKVQMTYYNVWKK